MTLTEIYDRIEDLIETISKNPENQEIIYNSEIEIASLNQLREEMEEGDIEIL